MNQEKIAKFIKEIRKKDNLTQEKFAEKYGVTYQSVSKWENGKSIPDILILKQMCNEYHKNLSDLLAEDEDNDKKKIITLVIIGAIIIIAVICMILLFNKDTDDFSFKKLSTTCDDFTLLGSIAYNKAKTSIYISNISYCGDTDTNEYKKIECVLYESAGEAKTKISSFNYKEDEPILLSEFLDNVEFKIEHYSNSCKMYQENGMILEITATNINDQTIFYNIPVKLEENCNE